MNCEGEVRGPTDQLWGYEGIHAYGSTCTAKATWIATVSFGHPEEVTIHCCTKHAELMRRNTPHIVSALGDFGIEATITLTGIQ